MKYIVNIITNSGKSKIEIVEANNVKSAEGKINKKNPECEVLRISNDRHKLDYYSVMKKRGL
jgi:hypothetical protein